MARARLSSTGMHPSFANISWNWYPSIWSHPVIISSRTRAEMPPALRQKKLEAISGLKSNDHDVHL